MTDDFVKKLQEQMLMGSLEMIQDPSMDSANFLLENTLDQLQEAQASGVELPPEVEAQIQNMKDMVGLTQQARLAEATGDTEEMASLAEQVSLHAGLDTSPDQFPEIFDAVDDGDLEGVIACLQTYNVNAQHGKYHKTVLYHAVAPCGVTASFPIIHALLDAGADPRIGLGPDSGVLNGFGFGYYQDGDVDELERVIRRCVDLGADLEQRSEQLDWTPLFYGITEWNVPVTEALLRAGANPNAGISREGVGFSTGKNALGMAISQPKIFSLLLLHGADPEMRDATGRNTRLYIQDCLRNSTDPSFKSKLQECLDMLNA